MVIKWKVQNQAQNWHVTDAEYDTEMQVLRQLSSKKMLRIFAPWKDSY